MCLPFPESQWPPSSMQCQQGPRLLFFPQLGVSAKLHTSNLPSPSHRPSRFTYSLPLCFCGHLPFFQGFYPLCSPIPMSSSSASGITHPKGTLPYRLLILVSLPHLHVSLYYLRADMVILAIQPDSHLNLTPQDASLAHGLQAKRPVPSGCATSCTLVLLSPLVPLPSAGPSLPQGPSPANLLTATVTLYTYFLPTKRLANCCHSHLETKSPTMQLGESTKLTGLAVTIFGHWLSPSVPHGPFHMM